MSLQKFFAEAYFTNKSDQARQTAHGLRVEKANPPILAENRKQAEKEAIAYFKSLLTPDMQWDSQFVLYDEQQWKDHLAILRGGNHLHGK